jgi:dienelactone hydrolase
MRAAALLIALVFGAPCATSMPSQESPPVAVAAPLGAETLGVEWRSLQAPGVGTILMAVARPTGKGPFPAVVILHGTHGFAREYVQLAKELAQDGIIAVAVCWFAPGEGQGRRFVSPVTCPTQTPRISSHHSEQATRTVDAVVRAVRSMPGVQANQIALFGHSRGGGAAWNHVLQRGNVQAVILNSAGYSDELIRQAGQFNAPLLILHGERDGPGDGGSVMTGVSRVRAFQSALRAAGKPVEVVIYKEGRHNDLFANASQHTDEVKRMRAFLQQQFRH